MIKDLIKIADYLDSQKMQKYADVIDLLVKRASEDGVDGLTLDEKYNSLLLRLERLERNMADENDAKDMESL
tara:strand:+ start:619 stop:834 length:216 start_codon:yes stop_codon:yes gene_type:complete